MTHIAASRDALTAAIHAATWPDGSTDGFPTSRVAKMIADALIASGAVVAADSETITVPRPHVPFGPKGIPAEHADANYLRDAARNIEFSRCMGSNLTATVVQLLNDAAAVLTERTR